MKGRNQRITKFVSVLLILVLLMANSASFVMADEVNEEETMTALELSEESEIQEQTVVLANSISGVLWFDVNMDGILDEDEEFISDYPVYLYCEDNLTEEIQIVTTDEEGKYEFTGMEPGEYIVGIKAEENGTEYLLPLVGIGSDNKFVLDNVNYLGAFTELITVSDDTTITNVNAGLRTLAGIMPMNITNGYHVYEGANIDPSITTLTPSMFSSLFEACDYINGQTAGNYTIIVTMDDNSQGATATINSGYTVYLKSDDSSNIRTITQANDRHLVVEGTLYTSSITFDGASTGGGVVLDGGNYNFSSGTGTTIFENCKSDKGGAIYIDNNGTFYMGYYGTVEIRNCTATYGGGVYVARGEFRQYWSDSILIEGCSAVDGGALYADSEASFILRDPASVTFVNGAFQNYEPHPISFINNTATNCGGAIYSRATAWVDLWSSEFIGNKAGNDGGAIYLRSSSLFMGYSLFEGNEATEGDGGAIYVANDATLQFDLTDNYAGPNEFYNNSAVNGSGGAIFTENTTDYTNINFYSFGYGLQAPYNIRPLFSGNTSSYSVVPRQDADTYYTYIAAVYYVNAGIGPQYISTSIYNHPVNNYDINTPGYQVTYNNNYTGTDGDQTYSDGLYYAPGYVYSVIGYADTSMTAKSDSTFQHWNTKADDSGDDYNASNTIAISTSDVELYAQWTYKVTYDPNEGTGDSYSDTNLSLNASYKVLDNGNPNLGYTKNLYTFTGWNTKADGSGTPYTADEIITISEDVILYAQWERSTGSITIEKYGDSTTPLPGAEFTIEQWNGTAWEYITYEASAGTWSVSSTAGEYTLATDLDSSGDIASLIFINLPLGKYRLTEVKAPSGYALLAKQIEVEIPYYDGTDYYYDLTYTVSDVAVIDLPDAGSGLAMRSIVLTGAFIALLSAAAYIYARKRRGKIAALQS